MVLWKVFVPLLTVVVLMSLQFHISNFTAGAVRALRRARASSPRCRSAWSSRSKALEQAVQMGGEAKNPQRRPAARDLHRH